MKIIRSRIPLCLMPLLFCVATSVPLRAAGPMALPGGTVDISHLHYLAAGQPKVIQLLAPPPRLDSPEQAADLAEVRAVHGAATSADVALARSQNKFTVFTFAPAVGAFFQSNSLPKTAAFFQRVQTDAEAVTDHAKNFYRRPRPYTTDPSLANGKRQKSFSYPSGHSTESMVLALVLADLLPAKQDAILAEARGIGWHRVQLARHYPTDIYAGRVLAQAIVRQFQKSEAFQTDFAAAQAELAAAQIAAKN